MKVQTFFLVVSFEMSEGFMGHSLLISLTLIVFFIHDQTADMRVASKISHCVN